MALQKSFEDIYGITHAASYSKVEVFEPHTSAKVVNIDVYTYVDAAARAAGKRAVHVWHYEYEGDDYDALLSPAVMDPVDTNPIKLIYVKLKTLDEWVGAVDV